MPAGAGRAWGGRRLSFEVAARRAITTKSASITSRRAARVAARPGAFGSGGRRSTRGMALALEAVIANSALCPAESIRENWALNETLTKRKP